MEKLSILLIFFLTSSLSATTITEPVFNRKLFEIRFHSDEFLTDSTLSMVVADLIQPLDKIATRFTKVNILLAEGLTKGFQMTLIPSAVAIYNRDHLKPNSPPLELSFSILVGPKQNSSELPLVINRFVNLADIANQIYPGTVKNIILEDPTYMALTNNVEDQAFEKYLSNARIPNHTEIKMGASWSLEYCQSDRLPQVLKYIRHVVFYHYDFYEIINGTPQQPQAAVEILWKKLIECQQIIQIYGSDISIGIESSWMALTKDKLGHEKTLVEYWWAMNDLAVKHNVSVVLSEAFDEMSNFTSNPMAHSGWWRVVKDKSRNQYLFTEKMEGLNSTYSNSSTSKFPWIYIVMIVLLIGFVILVLVGLLYARKYYPNFFFIQYASYIPSFGWCKM